MRSIKLSFITISACLAQSRRSLAAATQCSLVENIVAIAHIKSSESLVSRKAHLGCAYQIGVDAVQVIIIHKPLAK